MRAQFIKLLALFALVLTAGCAHRGTALRSMHDPKAVQEAYSRLPEDVRSATNPRWAQVYPDGVLFAGVSTLEGDFEAMEAYAAENGFFFAAMDELQEEANGIIAYGQVMAQCTDESMTTCATLHQQDVVVLRNEPKASRRRVGQGASSFGQTTFRHLDATHSEVVTIVQIVDDLTPDGAHRAVITARVMARLADENGYITYQSAKATLDGLKAYLATPPEERDYDDRLHWEAFLAVMGY